MKIIGRITRISSGVIEKGKRAGDDWESITVEGIRLFLPLEFVGQFARGELVTMEVAHRGDKALTNAEGRTLGYEAQYDLLTIEAAKDAEFA